MRLYYYLWLFFFFYLIPGFTQAQTVASLTGVAEIQTRADQAWVPVFEEDALEVGGAIRTFEGQLSLDIGQGGKAKLGRNSLLVRTPQGYQLVSGKLYAKTEQAQFFVSKPVFLSGEARFDRSSTAEGRAAILNGYAEVSIDGETRKLQAGEQVIFSDGAEIRTFSEENPWYRDLVSIGRGVGKVLAFQGNAELQPEGESWRRSEVDSEIAPVLRARTAEDSWLEVRFDNQNVIRLQANTEIILSQFERFESGEERTIIRLERGKIWAIVMEEDQPFEIETPGLVAGVRGTTFRVDTAENGEPPLIKTFEGEVAGQLGFDTVIVEENQQFDPVAGIEPLVLDAIDLFNISRDRIVMVPTLSLNPLASATDQTRLEFSGFVDDASVIDVSNGLVLVSDGQFSGEVTLLQGFNLLNLSARYEGAEASTQLRRPVISTAPQVLLLAQAKREPSGISLRGVTEPDALLTLRGNFGERRLQVNQQGRFQTRLPSAESGPLELEAQLASGQSARLELQLE